MADGPKSNCPASGIKYPLKRPQNDPSKTTTSPGSEPTEPSDPIEPGLPFKGRGSLMVSTLNQGRGCIISYGTWYTSGSCATFHAEKKSGGYLFIAAALAHSNRKLMRLFPEYEFTLKSSKGYCGFYKGALTCGGRIRTPTTFTVCFSFSMLSICPSCNFMTNNIIPHSGQR